MNGIEPTIKQQIITSFKNNVKGEEICLKEGHNKKHCGKEGHWLEDKMGIKHNAKNEPDKEGYERHILTKHPI